MILAIKTPDLKFGFVANVPKGTKNEQLQTRWPDNINALSN